MKRFNLITASVSAGLLMLGAAANAADHKDSVSIDTRISGDITDVYAFVDPANTNNVVLAMAVNPFTNPNENPGHHFEENYLYQIKIDNNQNNGAKEDMVIQFEFIADPDRSAQPYVVKMGTPGSSFRGPTKNKRLGNNRIICDNDDSFNGGANSSFSDGMGADGAVQCFAGVTDDSFQTDVAQYVFRVGLDPDEATNVNTQDVLRLATSGLLGELRGRPLRADTDFGTGVVNSGVDGFGGFNLGTMAVSVPKESLRGSGILDASQNGAVNSSLVGIWGTVSRPKTESYSGFTPSGLESANDHFNQFERTGQQLFPTVFVHDGFPFNSTPSAIAAGLSDGALRDLFNTTGPEDDAVNWDYLVFDTNLYSNLVISTNFNTVEGRALLLTAGGFTTPGTGTPLIAPSLASDSPLGQRRRALAELLLPDYIRLNIDLIPDAVRPGAAAAGNSDPVFGIGRWGVQNGRRPQDDVTDIYVRLAREFADVKFPDALTILGLGVTEFPGSSALGSRRALNCTGLIVETGPLGLPPLLGEVTLLENCDDSRIFVVLQGTDWTEPTQLDVNNLADQVQLRDFMSSFPYTSEAHPVPGEPDTSGFPNQHQADVL